jgi:hypothetical protein
MFVFAEAQLVNLIGFGRIENEFVQAFIFVLLDRQSVAFYQPITLLD